MNFKFFIGISLSLILLSSVISADELDNPDEIIKIGQNLVISSNYSKSRFLSSEGQVFYFVPGDAYRIMQARKFQDWDFFEVDARNLYRVVKNDSIKILETLFSGSIIKVELLNGPDKGRKYYAIKDELEKNFLRVNDYEQS
ncbi:MAG: hypothetical protein VW146_04455 [Gammaproteobacteria bacterium]